MRKHWSSLSFADIYEYQLNEKTHFDIKDKDGNITGCDNWENIYGTRSVVNDETLKKEHIVYVGDSFVYGHGISRSNTVSSCFDNLVSDKYSCFNLSEPGTGHDSSLVRLNQWCNSFGNQVHTVYFGISNLTRVSHWEADTNFDWSWTDSVYGEYRSDGLDVKDWKFLYSISNEHRAPTKILNKDLGIPRKQQKRSEIIYKSYTNLVSNVQSMTRLDSTISAVINLSKVYNFNVYFFDTCFSIIPEDLEVLKKLTENNNIKWCAQSQSNPLRTSEIPKKELDLLTIKNDGHWNADGNKEVARVIYNETKHWYEE
jgi:hypothetical protein